MKRNEYLANPHVTGFIEWAGHLVRGEWGLEHSWEDKRGGPPFLCSSLHEAFQSYRWPNTDNGDRFTDTMRKFDRFRQSFECIGIIKTTDQLWFFRVFRPAIFTDIRPPWEGCDVTNIRLQLFGQSPPLPSRARCGDRRSR